MNINAKNLNKLNVLWNKCTQKILEIESYCMTTTTILNRLGWLSFPQIIQWESKISYELLPPSLHEYLYHSLKISDIARLTRKPSVKYKSKTARTQNSFFYRTFYLYNLLPDGLRTLNKKQLAKELKFHIKTNFNLRTIPKIPT